MPESQDPRRSRWWPSHPSLLTDTSVCPACFLPLGGTLCLNCGIDLAVLAATDLLTAGSAVSTAEAERQELITLMRVEQEQRVLTERLARSAPPLPAPVYASPDSPRQAPSPSQPSAPVRSQTSPTTLLPPTPPFASPHQGSPTVRAAAQSSPPPSWPAQTGPAQTGPQRPRRSSIQILMLTVGVILVSVMALFFVLVAYLVASLEVRSVLTALASIAVFGVAVLLSRRRLQGTAEGITALAVILFLLDLWIVRANGVFGSGGVDGWLYAGLSIGVLTILLALAARLLPIRTLSLSVVLLGPVAVFSLVRGLLAVTDPTTSTWAAFTAVGLGSLAWPLISRPVERTILRVAGLLAIGGAMLAGFGALAALDSGGTVAYTVLAVVWFLALVLAPRVPAPALPPGQPDPASAQRLDGWGGLAAIGLGLAAAGAGVSVLGSDRVTDTIFWLPATVTAGAGVIVAALVRLPVLAWLGTALRIAALIPLGFAALMVAPSAIYSVGISAWGAVTPPFSLSGFESQTDPFVPFEFGAPLALLLVSALGFVALGSLRLAKQVAWLPAALGGFGLVTACAVIGQPVASALGLGILATLLLVAIVVLRPGSLRIALGLVFTVALIVFATIGLASTTTFPVTAITTVILLVAARQVAIGTGRPMLVGVLSPVLTGSAAFTLIVSARWAPLWFEVVTGTTVPTAVPVLWMTLTALVLSVGILFATDPLSRADLSTVANIALVTVALGLVELTVIGSAPPLLIALAVTAVASLSWQVPSRVADWPERYVAAAIAPAATLWGCGVAWIEFAPLIASVGSAATTSVALAAATVVLAGCAPLLFRRRDGAPGTHPARVAWDASLAVSAIVTIGLVARQPDLGWLTLVLLSVAALLVASGDGGIVAGSSATRHSAWIGLPLAVAGLWLGLARADATVIELYTLPVAGLLMAILWLTLARRPSAGVAIQPGRTILLASALIIGIGPSAVAATGGEPIRAFVVLGVAAALVCCGALVAPVYRDLRGGLSFWLTGAVAALIVGIGRPWLEPTTTIGFEVFSAGAALVLLAAGVLWHNRRRSPAWLATAAVVSSVLVLSLATSGIILTGSVEAWRAVTVLLVTCGFIIATAVRDEFSPALGWGSIAGGSILTSAIVLTGTADPFELAIVPLAAALLVRGGIRLGHDATRRSWPELGPGLLLLLVPSLAADLSDNELWRVVALGVVALGVLATGLILKLQAPALIGAVVVVLHGLAQLWPWISGLYGSVPWWLWAGIGGVILIVFAATYERRIRDLRAVARGISSLR